MKSNHPTTRAGYVASVTILALASLTSYAPADQSPTTAPADAKTAPQKPPHERRDKFERGERNDRGERPDRPRRFDRFDRGPGEPVRREPPDEKEWASITEFAKANFPNRIQAYEELEAKRGKGSRIAEMIRQRVAVRYRMLDRAKNDNPAFYEQALTQAKLEDDVWGRVRELKNNPEDAELRGQVREKVSALVQSLLAEREQRLQNMRESLDREQQRLTDDKTNFDKLVERQFDMMLAGGLDDSEGRGPRPRDDDRDDPRPPRDRPGDRSDDNPDGPPPPPPPGN